MADKDSYPDINPEKTTDYVVDGKQVVVAKRKGRPPKIRNPLFVPAETKVEACTLYTILGDIEQVSKLVKVEPKLIRSWQQEEWWSEMQKKIMMEQSNKLLGQINEILNTALLKLKDRLDRGDEQFIPAKYGKDGHVVSEAQTVYVPIKGRDLSQIFSHLTHQRNLMNGDPTNIVAPTSMEKQLEDLRKQFIQLAKGTVLDGDCKEIK